MKANTQFTPGPWQFSKTSTGIPAIFQAGDRSSFAVAMLGASGKPPFTLPNHKANALLIAQSPRMFGLAQRIANLNRDAGEIGAGMLAQLVDEARAIVADVEGQQ